MDDVRKMVKPQPMWCDGCRSVGAFHCAHPDKCGHMLTATDAADHWKAWIDDLPLPKNFENASGRLQDFITALACLADMPHPRQPAFTPTSDGRAEGLREAAQECQRLAESYTRSLSGYDEDHPQRGMIKWGAAALTVAAENILARAAEIGGKADGT